MCQEFAREEVVSRNGYFSGYQKPNSIAEQAIRLHELFPGLGNVNGALGDVPVLRGAEGKFVIPRWQTIAPTYNRAVRIVLEKIRELYGRKFYNHIKGELGARYLRETAAKKVAFQRLGAEQEGYDLLVVDGQFGILHRGRSVRRACVVMESSGQFGFGAFEVAIMLLTHVNRLRHLDDLWIVCAGDVYKAARSTDVQAPAFHFVQNRLEFDVVDVAHPCGWYGAASGFALQESSADA